MVGSGQVPEVREEGVNACLSTCCRSCREYAYRARVNRRLTCSAGEAVCPDAAGKALCAGDEGKAKCEKYRGKA